MARKGIRGIFSRPFRKFASLFQRSGGDGAAGGRLVSPEVEIIVAPLKKGLRQLPEVLKNLGKEKVERMQVVIAVDKRHAKRARQIVSRDRHPFPVEVLPVAGARDRRDLLRQAVECSKARYVAFMRPQDRWLPHGIWRLYSLGRERDAAIIAGTVRLKGDKEDVNSTITRLVRDRAYFLDVTNIPGLFFDSSLFGKLYTRDRALLALGEKHAIDEGGFSHAGVQKAYEGGRICLNELAVYEYRGGKGPYVDSLVPVHDPTFRVALAENSPSKGDRAAVTTVWKHFTDIDHYLPALTLKNGKKRVQRFLEEQMQGLAAPMDLLELNGGDDPASRFREAVVKGRFGDIPDLLGRRAYRKRRGKPAGEQYGLARKSLKLDAVALQSVQRKVRERAISGRGNLPGNGRLRRRRKKFTNYVISGASGFGQHRFGWAGVMDALSAAADPGDNVVFVDSFLEKTYCWDADLPVPRREVPWVGFAHRPQNIPEWYPENLRFQFYDNPDFMLSLDTCIGIFALSRYHADYLRSILPVPVDVLYHPADEAERTWDPNALQDEPEVVQVGFWLRNLHGICFLPDGPYRKIFLNKGSREPAAQKALEREAEHYRREGRDVEKCWGNVREISFLEADEYDDLLSRCVVFLDLYDASANNSVVECIARRTPLLVRRIPPVEEYLDPDYPLFFESLEEAHELLKDRDAILAAHRHLGQDHIQKRVSLETFIDEFQRSPLFLSMEAAR